jgi:hypothetical protein
MSEIYDKTKGSRTMISTGQTKNSITATNSLQTSHATTMAERCLTFLTRRSRIPVLLRARHSSRRPVLRREMLCSYPHLFSTSEICLLAWIIGESCDSGYDSGLDVMAKKQEAWSPSPNDSMASLDTRPRVENKAENGRSCGG